MDIPKLSTGYDAILTSNFNVGAIFLSQETYNLIYYFMDKTWYFYSHRFYDFW